jgi:hypothetical protein
MINYLKQWILLIQEQNRIGDHGATLQTFINKIELMALELKGDESEVRSVIASMRYNYRKPGEGKMEGFK